MSLALLSVPILLKGLQEASVYKETLKAVFAINRKIVNTAIGRDVREALAHYEMGVLPTSVSQPRGLEQVSANFGSSAEDQG